MITIKLPLKEKIEIDEYLKSFNSCVRFSYNRFVEKFNEKQIRHLIKEKSIKFTKLDSWFIQCAIREGKSWFKKFPNGKLIFGNKRNFNKLINKNLSNNEWKELRLQPICIQGEACKNGNRKFKLKIIENNQIIFKPSFGKIIILELPKLRKALKRKLIKLQNASKNCKISFTIRLNNLNVWITFDEKILKVKNVKLKENRSFSIDLNPNYIGWSVLEFNKNDKFKVIKTGIIENKKLNEKLNVSLKHPKQIYQNNKKEFEIFETLKFLINQCIHFQCSKFVIEELQIIAKNHKLGKRFNRLINNCWNRNRLITNLRKKCNIYNIEFIEVNSAYSSFVGNILYGEKYPDMISASIEINRRGFRKWQKNWFYPDLIKKEDLSNRWKKEINWTYNDWKELFSLIKTSRMNYRSSLDNFKFEVFSLNNTKSKVYLYSLH